MSTLPDGLIAIVKRDCPTCTLIEPLLCDLAGLTVYSQDDPAFPGGVPGVIDDRGLETSYRLGIEIVPILIRMEGGRETARTYGWDRAEWERVSGQGGLGPDLPEMRPGCGSKTQDPGMAERLAVRFGNTGLQARPISIPADADPVEACYERGWTDGLPVTPPTGERVLAMLDGTNRAPGDIVGVIPPDRVECTVEKAAINAVMAGCRPEYIPVLLSAIEAALEPEFGLHGIICTTNAVAPVIMVNGPLARSIGMNSKGNALGQGNRANAAIGRAFQLVMRNVGGGRPGGIDRAVFGNPGKYSFCFAEDEDDPHWESYAEEQGFSADASTVTLFPGDGVQPVIEQDAREPEDLTVTYAACLRTLYHPGQVHDVSAFLVVSPEHAEVFHRAGWSKRQLKDRLHELLQVPVGEVVRGFATQSPDRGEDLTEGTVPKFKTGSLNLVRAGGSAGLFSAIISGLGSITINPVTREIR
ncbi:MAG: hypothetical protein QGF09_06445 [Rhodospirillales bacterium]|nr:hypothetical protein [Rhodospirillales bacterium]